MMKRQQQPIPLWGAVVATLVLGAVLMPPLSWAQGRPISRARLKQVTYAYPVLAVNYVPFALAQRRGYYAEEGLDMQMIVVKAALSIKAALAGSIDYSGAGGSPVDAVLQGAKVKVLMAISHKPHFDLVAQPHIRSIQELRGKVVGVSIRGALTDLALREILVKHGLQPDRDVTIMEIGPESGRLAALKAKSLDGSMLAVPFNLLARDSGFHRLAYAGDYMQATAGGVSTTDRKIREQADEVSRFIRASLKGLLAYRAQREASLQVAMDFLGLKDREFAGKIYDNHMATLTQDGSVSEELMHITIERAKRVNQVQREVKNAEAFDFSFIRRAVADLNASGWKPN